MSRHCEKTWYGINPRKWRNGNKDFKSKYNLEYKYNIEHI